MTDDVRISVSLARHHKTKKLKRRLGPAGCWSLVVLFLWVGSERWDGTMSGMTDEDIELAADWDGEPGEFVDGLLAVGFLDGEKGQRAIHDWQEHNPYAASKGQRIEKGRQAAEARWHGGKSRQTYKQDATSMPTAYQLHSHSINEQCPPAPTLPNTQSRSKAKSGAPSAKRGCRLPVDWQPSDEDVTFAVNLRVDWRREAEAFRDYWFSKPGASAAKLDWSATWRNWVRRCTQKLAIKAEPTKSKTLQAIEKLQRMSYGTVDDSGSRDGVIEAAMPAAGRLTFGGHDRGNGGGLG